MRLATIAVAVALLTAGWSGGVAAQDRGTPFTGLRAPTPRIPPPAVGMIGADLPTVPGQAGEEEPESSPVTGMVVGATLGSLAGAATGALTFAAFCQDDCDYETIFALFAAGWVGGTAGSAIGVWTAGNEDGVSGGDAVLASLAGGAVGLAAGFGLGFPIAQGITTAVVAELLRE